MSRGVASSLWDSQNIPRVRRGAGFTLVELLVVIGIIGVLVSLLLPALHAAQASARAIACANQLKQQGVYVQMYVSDNRGMLPCGYELIANASSGTTVTNELSGWASNYLGIANTGAANAQTKILAMHTLECPEAMILYRDIVANGQAGRTYSFNSSSLYWNYLDVTAKVAAIVPTPPSPQSPATWIRYGYLCRYDQALSPSQTSLLFCSGKYIAQGGNSHIQDWTDQNNYPLFPHGGRRLDPVSGAYFDGMENVLFLDGHAESLRPDFTGLYINGVVPLPIPASGKRQNWNTFWKGTNSAN